jgi:hypothetical protein
LSPMTPITVQSHRIASSQSFRALLCLRCYHSWWRSKKKRKRAVLGLQMTTSGA